MPMHRLCNWSGDIDRLVCSQGLGIGSWQHSSLMCLSMRKVSVTHREPSLSGAPITEFEMSGSVLTRVRTHVYECHRRSVTVVSECPVSTSLVAEVHFGNNRAILVDIMEAGAR